MMIMTMMKSSFSTGRKVHEQSRRLRKRQSYEGISGSVYHPQGAEVTGQLRVNGKVRHLRRCTLEDQSLALKRKHRVHKYVNTATICVSVMNLLILTSVPR